MERGCRGFETATITGSRWASEQWGLGAILHVCVCSLIQSLQKPYEIGTTIIPILQMKNEASRGRNSRGHPHACYTSLPTEGNRKMDESREGSKSYFRSKVNQT